MGCRFAYATEITYTLPAGGRVQFAVYDVMGREHAVLADSVQGAGRHTLGWDGRSGWGSNHGLPAGVYFLRLVFDGRIETQKLVLAP